MTPRVTRMHRAIIQIHHYAAVLWPNHTQARTLNTVIMIIYREGITHLCVG